MDDDPNPAVVVAVPEGQTLADWIYEVDGEERTAAEANPDYPTDEQLVIAAFETVLDEYWPAWEDAAPEDLFEWTLEHQVLVVENLGETYAVAPDGTVQGDGAFADRLEDLVAGPPQ